MRIAISTGGGDCPGLNAVIRAAVRSAVAGYGWEVVGIEHGLEGLRMPNKLITLSPARVRGILPRGGTILGTTNRGHPFHFPRMIDGKLVEVDISGEMLERIDELGIDAVIFIGGDGTQAIAQGFRERGLNVIGVPKTIDNDLGATDYTFGFDTAVTVAVKALDRLHTTAESHDRVMILEVMGRDAGWIALHSGIAGGADVILIPEIPYDIEKVLEKINQRHNEGTTFSIIVIAEGAFPKEGSASYSHDAKIGTAARIGGAGLRLADALEARSNLELRTTVLGHLQRGGSPTNYDRLLGTLFGRHAIELAAQKKFGRMVCLRGTKIQDVDIKEAIGQKKYVDPKGQIVETAKAIGTAFGD